jgi:hypothetical protein
LIKEEDVRGTAFVVIEIKRLKPPTGPAIRASAHQRLKNQILSGHKSYGWSQHMSAKEPRIEKSGLTDLP